MWYPTLVSEASHSDINACFVGPSSSFWIYCTAVSSHDEARISPPLPCWVTWTFSVFSGPSGGGIVFSGETIDSSWGSDGPWLVLAKILTIVCLMGTSQFAGTMRTFFLSGCGAEATESGLAAGRKMVGSPSWFSGNMCSIVGPIIAASLGLSSRSGVPLSPSSKVRLVKIESCWVTAVFMLSSSLVTSSTMSSAFRD